MSYESTKEQIIRSILEISGKYSPYEVFNDWVKCCAIAISNQTDLLNNKTKQRREEEYIETMKKYTRDERVNFVHLFYQLIAMLSEKFGDALGEIYMGLEQGNSKTGQFFTPYHISVLTAETRLTGRKPGEPMFVYEPSCGSGGMIIATAEALTKRGENPQRIMKITACDIDWRCIYMSYIQLSLLGLKAIVRQGDTLTQAKAEPMQVYKTPAEKGVLINVL